jgi:hypothetical protein
LLGDETGAETGRMDVERDEIEEIAEAKVRLAIADLKTEILPQFTEIKGRLIGIDGNGTGREGAIQVLNRKMDTMGSDVSTLLRNDSRVKGALTQRQEDRDSEWWRQPVGVALVVAVIEFASKFIEHKVGW